MRGPRVVPGADPHEREQAWADLKTAVQEVVVPPLEAIVRFLTRVIDRLSPPKPFERSLSLVGGQVGRSLDGLVGWIQQNPDLLRHAMEMDGMKDKAAALGASSVFVDQIIALAFEEAAEMGADPMVVVRARWEDAHSRLAMGMTEGQAMMALKARA